MSEQSAPIKDRPDALLDAYRQASAHDGARPGPRVREAVLAHARVVAQSAASATGDAARTMSEAIVRQPAANDRAWYWRAAAGLVLGIAGVWMYRLTTQPAVESTVAAASAPAPAAAAASEKTAIRDGNGAAGANVATAPVPPAAAAVASQAPAAALPAETQIAVAGAKSAKKDTAPASATARESAADQMAFNVGRARTGGETARATLKADEPVIALAKPAIVGAAPSAAPVLAARTPQPFPASPAAAAVAPPAAEDTVALAEMAKRSTARVAKAEQPAAADAANNGGASAVGALARSDRAEVRSDARAKVVAEQAAAAAAAPAAPSASTSTVASVPAPMPAAAPPPARIGDMTPPMQQGMANVALFAALRSGQVESVRNAIVRGANVNARDDRGRTPLQIARENNQTEIIRLLEAAGAK